MNELNFEFAPFAYWKRLNYDDGLLYLALLNIDGKDDWRMLTLAEIANPKFDNYIRYKCWNDHHKIKRILQTVSISYQNEKDSKYYGLYQKTSNSLVIPVRDN
jgi:hypothetical protein